MYIISAYYCTSSVRSCYTNFCLRVNMNTIQNDAEVAINEPLIKYIQNLNKFLSNKLQLNISNDGNIVKIKNLAFEASKIKRLLLFGRLAEDLCTKLILFYLQGDTAVKYAFVINKLANYVYLLADRILGKVNIDLNILDATAIIGISSWYQITPMRLIQDLYELSQILQRMAPTIGHNTVANAIIAVGTLISLLKSSISLTGNSRIPVQQSKL